MSRALSADLFELYESPALANVPDDLELDSTHRLTPVDYGDVCLNYDKAWFAANGVPVPQSLQELTDPAYNGLLIVENPNHIQSGGFSRSRRLRCLGRVAITPIWTFGPICGPTMCWSRMAGRGVLWRVYGGGWGDAAAGRFLCQ